MEIKKIAPIALFVYNRIENVRRCIESIQNNTLAKESDLYIFSDGPKNPTEEQKVLEVRAYLKTVSGFKSIVIEEKQNNLGLAASIIKGVTEMVEKFGKVIILEDDLILSPYFLAFVNDGLNLYEKDEQVMAISGYLSPIKPQEKLPETFFLHYITTWGWGTWDRAWQKFNPDPKDLLVQIKKRNLEYRLNIDGSRSFLHHLKANIIGRWNTWGIKWYVSVLLSNGLVLFPSESFSEHAGFGEDATHSKSSEETPLTISNKQIHLERIETKESQLARKALKQYFLSREKNLIKRYFNLFKENLKRIPLIKWGFDFLRSKLYDERNAV